MRADRPEKGFSKAIRRNRPRQHHMAAGRRRERREQQDRRPRDGERDFRLYDHGRQAPRNTHAPHPGNARQCRQEGPQSSGNQETAGGVSRRFTASRPWIGNRERKGSGRPWAGRKSNRRNCARIVAVASGRTLAATSLSTFRTALTNHPAKHGLAALMSSVASAVSSAGRLARSTVYFTDTTPDGGVKSSGSRGNSASTG